MNELYISDCWIYFKTDKNFRKTQQLFKNNRVAMCFNGTQVEGTAVNKGLVVDEPCTGTLFGGQ